MDTPTRKLAVALCLVAAVLLTAVSAAIGSVAQGPSESLLSTSNEADETRIPGQYIVVLEDSVEHPGNVARNQAAQRNGRLGFVYASAINGYSVAGLSKSDVEALREDPRVKYVQPDRRVELFSQEVPTGVTRVNAPADVTADIDGSDDARVNVDVAVIDTGIDHVHPDLNVFRRANCVPVGEGFNSAAEGEAQQCVEGTGTDGYGHGTHVAGTLGAIDNGDGVAGVAPGARLWSVRVFNKNGEATASWWIAGVNWVTARASSIEVANMSLGCRCPIPALEEAINASVQAGVVYVVAAGNSAASAGEFSPARNPNAVTVSALSDYDGNPGGEAPPLRSTGNGATHCRAVDESETENSGVDDTLATFSNFGSAVDVAAPGVCIYSTLPTGSFALQSHGQGYGYLNGTSMAAPHVAGTAALLASKTNPNSKTDVEAIRQKIADEGSQDWTDVTINTLFDEETVPDSVQEPRVDLAAPARAVYTTRATAVSSSARLNGGLNPNGSESTYRFEYGKTTSYGSTIPASPKSAGAGSKDLKVSELVTGLAPDTTYHFRLTGTSASGTIHGADRTLKTAPSVTTGIVRGTGSHKATIRGHVNPLGAETKYQFEWGLDTSYGMKIPSSPQAIGSGTEAVEVNALLEGLETNTTYHYRLVAYSDKFGTLYGKDGTFKTSTTGFTSPVSPVSITSRPNSPLMAISTRGSFPWEPVLCVTSSLSADLSQRSEVLSMNSTDAACGGEGKFPLKMNGCRFEFYPGHLTEEYPDGARFNGSFGIGPSGCGPVTLEAGTYCKKVAIPPQSGGITEYLMTEGSEGTKLNVAVRGGFRYTQEGDACTSGTFGDGRFEAAWELSAKGPNGKPADMAITRWFTHATTGGATDLDRDSATLNGIVGPARQGAFYTFEYGPTTQYGHETAVGRVETGVDGPLEASAVVHGLQPGQPYHYRLAMVNDEGVFFGKDRTFEIHTPRFEAEQYPASLAGNQDPADGHVVSTEGGPLTCGKVTMTGSLTADQDHVALVPSYSECQAYGFNAAVAMNGCSYGLDLVGTVWDDRYPATMDVVCPAGKAIEISAATCSVSIGAQTGLGTVRASSLSSASRGSLVLDLGVDRLKYTKTKDGIGCPFSGTGSKGDGRYSGSSVVEGTNGAQRAIGLGVSGVEVDVHPPRFEGEGHPLRLAGEQTQPYGLRIGTEAGSVECGKATLEGQLAGPSAAITMAPAFSECRAFGLVQATVTMNGCNYGLSALAGSGGEYPTTLSIACPEGKAIEVLAGTCALSIPQQTGLGTVQSANDGASTPPRLNVELEVGKLRYTKTKDGIGCSFAGLGAKEDGAYSGQVSVRGTNEASEAIGLRIAG